MTYGMERRMCSNCITIQTFPIKESFKCKFCSHTEFSISSDFDREWTIHHSNKLEAERLETKLSLVKAEIDKFETNWFKSWNTDDDIEMGWECPKEY
jgi:hypothetical protein